MKLKKLSLAAKFVIAVIIISIISFASVGIAGIFAEPTIEDLTVNFEREYGEFEIDHKINMDVDKFSLRAWLNTTQLFFQYDWWTDYNNDGVVDHQDVYEREDFQSHMLMYQHLVPILEVTNKETNYYIVDLSEFTSYTAVPIVVQMSENNDDAKLHDSKTYWYDEETSWLYIDKELIADDIEDEKFNTIRIETIMLMKNLEELNKNVDVFTFFDKSITNTHGLYTLVPNETMSRNVQDWEMEGLSYTLTPKHKLGYIKSENLEVYVNDELTEYWEYDETTGELKINCSPFYTNQISVIIKKMATPSNEAKALLAIQMFNGESAMAASSVSMEDAIKNANYFLKLMDYDDQMPKVGTTERLEFNTKVVPSRTGAATVENVYNAGSAPITLIHEAMKDYVTQAESKNNTYIGATLSAFVTTKGYSAVTAYNNTLHNVAYAQKQENAAAQMTSVVSYIEQELMPYVTEYFGWDSSYGTSRLQTAWKIAGENQMYVCGSVESKNFLGGEVVDGYQFFEMTCAEINTASIVNYAGLSVWYDTDLRNPNATIVKVNDIGADGTGYMFVCIWSDSLHDASYNNHTQRLLAFSKIKYRFNGIGTLQFSKIDKNTTEHLADAKYGIYRDPGCTQLVDEIVSQSAPVSIDLNAGTYYLKELEAPEGYRKSNDVETVVITGGQTTKTELRDERQMYNFELYVYDATTRWYSHKKPLEGVPFEVEVMTDAGPRTIKYVTDANGKISGSIEARGAVYLKQTATINNYAMQTTEGADCCTSILLDARPNKSGEDINKDVNIPLVHYEQRQTISLWSHVQDVNLGDKSPAILSQHVDHAECYVSLVGSKYNLYAVTPLLLGYKDDANRTAVIAPAGSLLKTVDSENNGAKSCIEAATVVWDGVEYPLPNGTYKWVLQSKVSSGYIQNGTETQINASWAQGNQTIIYMTINNVPVKQTRQTAKINMTVKSYVDKDRKETAEAVFPNVFRNKNYTVVNRLTDYKKPVYSLMANRAALSAHDQLVNKSYTKTVTSNSTKISTTSKEAATLYTDTGSPVLSVASSGLVPNAVYVLMTLDEIVDVQTGECIPANTQLGIYRTDANGQFVIDHLGSNGFTSENDEMGNRHYGNIVPLSVNNSACTSELPNGMYALTLIESADGTESELGLEEDIVYTIGWTGGDKARVETDAIGFLRKKDPEPDQTVIVAPNPPTPTPITETNLYDPKHPEDPFNEDDSDDIPLVSTDWVDKNQYNFAYRIVDESNVHEQGEDLIHEVQDQTPITFSFYLEDDTVRSPYSTYEYNLTFYYEISKEEYDKTNASYDMVVQESSGPVYLRRFREGTIAGGEPLTSVITLNKKSAGAVLIKNQVVDYTKLKERGVTVSGAIDNDSWINEQLRNQPDGEFRIYICVEMVETRASNFAVGKVEKHCSQTRYGVLIIKDRQLVIID